jgi:hypothetical protein
MAHIIQLEPLAHSCRRCFGNSKPRTVQHYAPWAIPAPPWFTPHHALPFARLFFFSQVRVPRRLRRRSRWRTASHTSRTSMGSSRVPAPRLHVRPRPAKSFKPIPKFRRHRVETWEVMPPKRPVCFLPFLFLFFTNIFFLLNTAVTLRSDCSPEGCIRLLVPPRQHVRATVMATCRYGAPAFLVLHVPAHGD